LIVRCPYMDRTCATRAHGSRSRSTAGREQAGRDPKLGQAEHPHRASWGAVVVRFVVAQSPSGPDRATEFNRLDVTHWKQRTRNLGVSGEPRNLLWEQVIADLILILLTRFWNCPFPLCGSRILGWGTSAGSARNGRWHRPTVWTICHSSPPSIQRPCSVAAKPSRDWLRCRKAAAAFLTVCFA